MKSSNPRPMGNGLKALLLLFTLLAVWVLAAFVQLAACLTHGYVPQWYTPWLLFPLSVFAWIADLFR
jgi:hypothetical protein